MKVATVAEVRADFAVYLKASEKGPVVVTRHSKPVAVLLATDNKEDLERLLLGHSPKLQAILQAAQMVLAPLKEDPPAGLVIDLTQVNYFGSVFLSFLLRCHMLAKKHGSEVVLAGASERTRELLHLTALDTLWALYNTRAEAIEALAGSE